MWGAVRNTAFTARAAVCSFRLDRGLKERTMSSNRRMRRQQHEQRSANAEVLRDMTQQGITETAEIRRVLDERYGRGPRS